MQGTGGASRVEGASRRTASSRISCDHEMSNRGHWRPCEDEMLRQLVGQYGPKNWNFIAKKLPGRSGKSCRLRWFNQLDPRINRSPLTEDEEERLLAAHRIYGNRWSLISRFFPGRTDNSLKNQWHVIHARRQRAETKTTSKELEFGRSLLFTNQSGFLASSTYSSSNSGDFSFCSTSNPDRNQRHKNWIAYYDTLEKRAPITISRNEPFIGRNMEKEGRDEVLKVEVPFIDFLGVGFAS